MAKKQPTAPTAAPTCTNCKCKADNDHDSLCNAEASPSHTNSSTHATNHAAASSSGGAPSGIPSMSPTVNTPSSDEVTLHACYHFTILPDHVGPRFQQWTIVLAAVNVRLWEMPETANASRPSMTFQMVLKSLKILQDSDSPEESITMTAPGNELVPQHATSTVPIEIANNLASFRIPAATEDDTSMTDAPTDEQPTLSSVSKGKKKCTY
ncbi:hypothetical protein EWM64_g9440 [Hericium alpestre]|uniref:Uncharacterized protein n=1 Tax=Hericium alpestre TaxID=135208 RepID=A0A4Y9ZIS0_9AGAM|nr:hypothetical protein EWM64_g9440 [Hericium alpestre]